MIPHSGFDMISVTPEKEAAYIREQVGELEQLIREMEATRGRTSGTIRQIEKLKERRRQKLKSSFSGKEGRHPLLRSSWASTPS